MIKKHQLKKLLKISLILSFLILILAVLKTLINGTISQLTISGALQAVAISFVTGTVGAVALMLKDNKG
ncbi:hypothetical protein GTW09_16370 [Alteromonas hispanica]|uniref:Uncharacterized protein n=1 Tax=Alteromonas hispanica TaxID=315421 RepID=A0A6L9MXX9_9ALTE|nr:hypothetical protein [Alteromonas hispanica]